ncbi:MAG TPA: hypothetical protein VGO33_03525 [Gemmatimonadaceae bacterium]|jgi:hypothetical protein|nr:hypothetical protein [Gemmatimonadaceae bacterium]
MLALPVSGALGSVQDKLNESRIALPPSAEKGFSGEIAYEFDTALNMSTVRFKTSLAPRGIFARMFQSSPAVHTLTAAYEFMGRGRAGAPDSIRISLTSDEFSDAPPGNGLPRIPQPVLTVTLDDSVARFPLGISQKTEVWWPRDSVSRAAHSDRDVGAGINFNARQPQMHVTRDATVRLSACAFFGLVASKNLHGTVAGLPFELNEDVIAGLREFAAGMSSYGAAPNGATCRNR